MATQRKLSKLKLKLLREGELGLAIRGTPMPDRVFEALEVLDAQRLINLDCGYQFVKWTLTHEGRKALNQS